MRVRVPSLLAVAALAAACGRAESPRTSPSPRASPSPVVVSSPPGGAPGLTLPKKPGSLRFAVIGDSGRGDKAQYDVAAQMVAFRKDFEYDLVVMAGDNIYEGSTAEDYRKKFELPYKPLLDAGVKFQAVIGNHDEPMQHLYPLFNMGGHKYYTFKPERKVLSAVTGPSVRFFMLDTENLDLTQILWLRQQLGASDSEWKIPVFHRPMYTSGRYALPAQRFRRLLEPIFVLHGVRVAFSGHEHFYERTQPQKGGIVYFISGGAGSLRKDDIRQSLLTAAGFDDDYHFMLVEIAGSTLYFQAISRTGATVDSGSITLR